MQILFYTYTCILDHKQQHSITSYIKNEVPKISNICNISSSYFDYEKLYTKCLEQLKKSLKENNSIKIYHNTEYVDELDYEVIFESEYKFIDLPRDQLTNIFIHDDLDNTVKAQIIIYFQEVEFIDLKDKINTTLH